MASQRRDKISDELIPSSLYSAFLNIRRPYMVTPGDGVNSMRVTSVPDDYDGYINEKMQEIVVFDPGNIAIIAEDRVN